MLDKEYWNNRWKLDNTGWDLGQSSPPLMEFLNHLKDKNLKILIPGSGSGYEAGEAYNAGFRNIYFNDISSEAALRFKQRYPNFPEDQILNEDYFKLIGKFDIILEQTSFCAHPPVRRPEYIDKAYKLLVPGGLFAGVLFNIHFPFEGPPFGGNQEEYEKLFSQNFKIIKMEICYNSIIPRQGNELFVILQAQ